LIFRLIQSIKMIIYQAFIKKRNLFFIYGVIVLMIAESCIAIIDTNFSKLIATIAIIVNITIISSLLFFLFRTQYSINGSELACTYGPFSRKIDIKTIHKIEFHNGIIVPSTWRMSINTSGLIVYYNKYDDVYISPKNQDSFLENIVKVNPEIKILKAS